MKKRILSFLLAAIMVVSLLPVTAFADLGDSNGDYGLTVPGVTYMKVPFSGYEEYSIQNIKCPDDTDYESVYINGDIFYISQALIESGDYDEFIDAGLDGAGWYTFDDESYCLNKSNLSFDSDDVFVIRSYSTVSITLTNPESEPLADYSFEVNEEEGIDNRLEFPTSGTVAFFYSTRDEEEAEPKTLSDVFKFSEGAVPVRFDIFTVNSETNFPVILNNGRECEVIEDEGSEGTLTFADGAGDLELPHDEAFFIHIHDWTRTSEAHNCETETTATDSTTIDHDTVMKICPVEFLEQKNGNTSQAHTSPLPCTACGGYGVSAAAVTGGTVSVAPAVAAKGEKVTVTATPSVGYTLTSVSADQNVTPEKQEDGSYTFTMPAANVIVTAEFYEPPHTHGEGDDAIIFEKAIKTAKDLRDLFKNGGSGYLANDITLDSEGGSPVVQGEYGPLKVDLCLNGKVLDLNGQNIQLIGAEFNLYDCDNTTEHQFLSDIAGNWTLVQSGNVPPVFGGVITGGSAEMGGAVLLIFGDFNMYGGNIVGNKASGDGGGVYVLMEEPPMMEDEPVSTFTMYGGMITGNRSGGNGGGVGLSDFSAFRMFGGEIENNCAWIAGGGLYAGAGCRISFGGEAWISGNRQIIFGDDNDCTFTRNDFVYKDKDEFPPTFVSVDPDHKPEMGSVMTIFLNRKNMAIHNVEPHTKVRFPSDLVSSPENLPYEFQFNEEEQTLTLVCTHEHSFTSYTADGAVLTAHCEAANCDLKDSQVSLKLTVADVPEGLTPEAAFDRVTLAAWLDAGLEEPNLGDVEYWEKGGEAALGGCPSTPGEYEAKLKIDDSITLVAPFAICHKHNGSAIIFRPISTLEQLAALFTTGGDGYLTKDINVADEDTEGVVDLKVENGRIVNLCLNDKVLNLQGRMIAVNGELNLYDCGKTVRYYDKDTNTGLWTLAADQSKATDYTTTGGVITGGTGGTGGCLSVENGSLTMNGGNISGNMCGEMEYDYGDGGGVYVYQGSFTMNGGCICGNSAGGSSGGVSVYYDGSFTMNGGCICGNTAADYGGGISIFAHGEMIMTGGEISGNTAGKIGESGYDGGGVNNCGTMTMLGGTITGNTCGGEGSGGGIDNGGTLTLGGTAVVTGNFKEGAPCDVENGISEDDPCPMSISAEEAPAEGMNVGLYGSNSVVTNATEGDLQYFFASDNANYEAYFDDDDNTIKLKERANKYWYIDEDGEYAEVPTEATKATAASSDSEWNTAWVLATGNVKITNGVMLANDVNLILADGASLEIAGTIFGVEHTLTVYAQTNGTGKLTANSETTGYSTAYGMAGSVTVNGGNVKLSGKAESYDGYGVKDGNVTVNGGSVEISGTGSAQSYTGRGVSGNVTVNGGTAKISGSGGSGFGVMGESITVTGDGVLTVSGTTLAIDMPPEANLDATVEYSDADDGKAYDKEWDGKTELTQKYLKLTVAHIHSFTYEADGATLTATCTGTVGTCKLKDKQMSLTLTGDVAANAAAVKAWNDAGAAAATIKYYAASDTKFETPLDAPVKSGKYTVKATASDKTASLEFDYVSPYWYIDPDPETGKVELETLPDIIVTADTISWSGWVFVSGNVKIENAVTLNDNVNLILADGASLEITNSIFGVDKTLTVYAQTNGTGKLTVKHDVVGNVTVNGGDVEITVEYQQGGTATGVEGDVTVNGGSVKITGKNPGGGGGGEGVRGNVTVNGGDVEIVGVEEYPSFGHGHGVDGGSVTVTGGKVKISGSHTGDSGHGIFGNEIDITVTGGELTVYGSTKATNVAKENINAAVQTSADGTTYADWDEKTALNTFNYLKLTAAHTHSFTYSASGATLTATCTEDCADYYSTPITLTLTAADAFYDGAPYDGASTDDTTVKFAETTGASIGNLTYYSLTETEEGGQKKTVETLINGAPANAGSYKVKVTVTYDTDKTVTAEKAFTINPRPVTLVAGSAEKVYDGNPLTCVTYSIEADTTTAGYGFVGEEGLASVSMTSASTITNVGSTDNVIDTPTEKSNTNLANYTVTTKKGTLTVKPLAETAPAANEGYTLDYAAETLKAKTGYEVSSANGDTATALTNDKVTPGSISQTFYVRKLASDTNHAPSAWTAITVPARPATPAAPTLYSVTADTVVVTAVAGQVYSIDGGTNWLTGTDGKVTFSGLTAASAYSIITRKAAVTTGGSEAFASANSTALTGYTAAATPANAAATGTVSYSEETFTLTDGYEISETDAPGFSAMQPTDHKVALQPNKTYYIRKAATTTPAVPASAAIQLTIPARPTAPAESAFTKTAETVENKKDGSFSGITADMEYKKGDGGWASGPAALTGLSNETVKVRYKAADAAFKSEEYSYTFTPSTAKLTVTMGETTAQAAYASLVSKPSPDPEKADYTFGGWYKDEACTQAWNFAADTVTEDMTLYPKWIRNAVQKAAISGKVTESSVGVPGAAVELYLGTVKVAATVTKDSPAGDYSFDNVENGIYNIVVTTADGKTKTEMVTVNTADTFTKNVELPDKAVSSVVEVEDTQISNVKSDVSKTVVGGLDEIAKNTAVSGGDKITIKLTVKPKNAAEVASAEDIRREAGNGKKIEFLDMSLWKQVNNDAATDIGDGNTQLLTIVIPFDFTGVTVSSVKIIRNHGGVISTLGDASNKNEYGEYVETDEAAGTVTLHAMKFSDYALAYAEQTYFSGGVGAATYAVTGADTENGKLTLSKKSAAAGTTVTVTVTPDEGYKLNTLTVKDSTGKELTLTKVNDTTYTFEMPSGKVTISAAFTEIADSTVCPQDATCVYAKFTDADTKAWYHDGVHFCVENGYMQGVSAAAFDPSGTTTRAMIVTMLWRMEGEPVVNYAMTFKDVEAGRWYTEAIRWAQSTGVVEGYSAEVFGSDDPITREQMAAILYRCAKYHGIDVANTNTLADFTDVSKVSVWALDAMQWANAVGLVQGRTATTLVPGVSITRAEAATMVQRYCNAFQK